MPTKKINQAEPLFDPETDTSEAISVPTVEEAKARVRPPFVQAIYDQLEALEPAPFREVLSDILASFKGTRWKGVDPDKRIKAAKDLAMLIGYSNPSVIINNNTLHVERMTDVQIMAELGKARAQLALVMGGDATVLGTDLACQPAADPTGGLGDPAGDRTYAKGGHAAHANPEIEDAPVIEVPRPPTHSEGGEADPKSVGEAKPKPGTMAAKIAELRAAGKISTPSNQNSKAPAAGATRPSGRKGGKK